MSIIMVDAKSPNIISGLVGWYTGLSAEVTSGLVSSWKDISGQGNHVTSIRGSPLVTTGVISATPGESIAAFHYGNFSGSGTRATAAQAGRIFADTLMSEIPPEYGSLVSATTASGQTTYTWAPVSKASVDVLVVAGGGTGGHEKVGTYENGGGGGGGGVVYTTNILLDIGVQTIIVGQGGIIPSVTGQSKGGDSSGFGFTALGGGGGSTRDNQTNINGGSGGGAVNWRPHTLNGTATQPSSASGGFGNNGGVATQVASVGGGSAGGGGAGGGGADGATTIGGAGGNGLLYVGLESYGSSGYFAGGGGGGGDTAGSGGSGGGGAGGIGTSMNGTSGTAHTGGGGGGNYAPTGSAGNGGSGTVIVRIRVVDGRGPTQFPFLYGPTTAGLRFPTSVMNTSDAYTLFHVARYYKPSGTPTRRRIFDGVYTNWLSGFWDGRTGAAHHTSWVTPYTDIHGNNWVQSTDQRNMYRSNGTDRTSSGYSTGTSDELSINNGTYISSEASDWACAEVIVYNRELTSSEYLSVEAYLSAKYFDRGIIPATGIISGSLLIANFHEGADGPGGASGYPISISRLGRHIGTSYASTLNASDFRPLTLSAGLIKRTYSHTASVHPTTEQELTTLFSNATRTGGPDHGGNINTRVAAAADYYGIIWIGYIYIATSGTYTFGTNSDDASDMHINYTRVAHAYGGHGVTGDLVPYGIHQYTADLKQGYYRFAYRFEETGGGDGYQALWKTPGSSSWAAIPSSVFFHDSRDQTTSSEPIDPTIPFP